jgi:iron(III) transport system ATP-binding protein
MTAMQHPDDEVLALHEVSKRFGSVVALDSVSLHVRRGELLAVVGPSGCGKSTMLRAVAGLVGIDSGTVIAGGIEVAGPRTFVPPERRDVGVVFQDLALFPHLDVSANVAFGLGRGHHRRDRVTEVLDLVGMASYGGRFPHELSGGEQQRVALARALAPAPAVVLLDEPFSHLDRNLRTLVREHTVQVLRFAGATGVFVTHDQEEALAAGDRVAVMRAGRLEQIAEPETVFHRPSSEFVATFLGEADFVPGEHSGTQATTAFGVLPVTEVGSGRCLVMLRPHEVQLEPDPDGSAVVVRTEFRGAMVLHHVRLPDGSQLRGLRPHSAPLAVGSPVTVRPLIEHPLAVFPG